MIKIRPTEVLPNHIYNVRNQGWALPRKDKSRNTADPLNIFYNHYKAFPAEDENVSTGLTQHNETRTGYPLFGEPPWEAVIPENYDAMRGLAVPAAKGFFIIDALKRGPSRYEAFKNLYGTFTALKYPTDPVQGDITSGGATVSAQYAGRVFYGGFGNQVVDPQTSSPLLSSYILFSQVIKDRREIVKCYQEGDPTSKDNSDVVDTDGGFIKISGIRDVVGLKPLSDALVVIGSNGVWAIKGGSSYGFTATNYAVSQISTFGCLNPSSIVAVNDTIYYFSWDGICQIAKNQFGDLVVTSVSRTTIQSFVMEMINDPLKSIASTYDETTRTVRWLFYDNVEEAPEIIELILDMDLGSFTKNRIYATSTENVFGYAVSGAKVFEKVIDYVVVTESAEAVYVGFDEVTAVSGVNLLKVTESKFIMTDGTDSTKYTFGGFTNESFKDFGANDAKAFILTGTVTAGDSAVAKQTPYLVVHLKRTEEEDESEEK